MRRLLAVALLLLSVLAVPASAALDPSALVLRPGDVPAGFRLDRDKSGVRSNAYRMKETPEFRSVLLRSGRITGYQAQYTRARSTVTVDSLADVFRGPDGARMVLLWFDRGVRKQSHGLLERASTEIGAEGWVYGGSKPTRFTLVAWRHGRVFGAVFGLGASRDTTMALARTQQRRIVSALG